GVDRPSRRDEDPRRRRDEDPRRRRDEGPRLRRDEDHLDVNRPGAAADRRVDRWRPRGRTAPAVAASWASCTGCYQDRPGAARGAARGPDDRTDPSPAGSPPTGSATACLLPACWARTSAH
ncbi:hypothetical protein, partial [Frankia sp. Cr1]|uniref:hypothetical protein n=1 Tax=Frankia sp. Cr1 TaxID=3073931 RepID=UPI002AD38B0D